MNYLLPMIDIKTARPLKIENENNKLDQLEFIQLHFAPPRAGFNKQGEFVKGVIEADFNRIYVIKHNGANLFIKLTDFTRIKFADISNSYTMMCSGMTSYNWKVDFMTRYPATTNDTEMAIYHYERVEN